MAVFKKGNRWYADLYQNGRRIRRAIKIDGKEPSSITRNEALKVESIYKAELSTGVKLSPTTKSISFQKLVEMYLKWAEENHRHPQRDRTACKSLISFFKRYNAHDLNLFIVEKYKSKRKKDGLQPDSINRELSILRRIFNLAVEWKKIEENPIKGLKTLRVVKQERRVLREWEFNKLYHAANENIKPILLFGYMTGARPGEIRKLKWEDVNLREAYVIIRKPKNDEERSIPLNQTLLSTLKVIRETNDSEFVFTYNNNPYISESSWRKAWQSAVKKSGIDYCTPHCLRHTFVSNLIVNHKEDFATVMAISGHKSLEMLKRYSHTRNEAKKRAVEKLEFKTDRETIDTYSDTSTSLKL